MFRIARTTCARCLELEKPYGGKTDSDDQVDSEIADGVADTQKVIQWIREALEGLKPSERDAVILRYQVGLNYQEIASICNKSESVAQKQVSRALLRLRTYLKDKVVV